MATAYLATDLVSDQPGVAPILDPHLVNAWGIALSPTGGTFWVSSEVEGLSTLYRGDFDSLHPLTKADLEVTIPGGSPTGQVFNGTSDFVVTNGMVTAPARFIFASLSGQVTGWNPTVAPDTAKLSFDAMDGAIYTGIALANNGSGNFLYLADFHHGEIDVLDKNFDLVTLPGNFADPDLPTDFAPFNVAAIGGKLYVAYAKRDANGEDEVAGPGLGFVDVFDLDGNFDHRVVSNGALNAPWAMVVAPADFGDFSGDLLVGNFGDGRINAYDAATGLFQGTLSEAPGKPIEIEGLWGLTFGNGVSAGSKTSLYYAAGPEDETHGLFGKITANPAGTNPVQATLDADGNLLINGSRNDDHVLVRLQPKRQEVIVQAGGQVIGTFDQADVAMIHFTGFAGDDHFHVVGRISIPTILDGGAGDDHLHGSRSENIMLGGQGDDLLMGSLGRDILIGGEGSDLLLGGAGSDLLIGGSTVYDSKLTELLQIMAEWGPGSGDSYSVRVSKLRNGSGVPKLDSTTVSDDGARDILFGGTDLDWFFASDDDLLIARRPNEELN